MMIPRRLALATAAGTLAATALPRKPQAETLAKLSEALDRISPPQDPPDTAFLGPDGSPHHLSDFKGRGMVVNLWATWCAPCGAEMPSLQQLSKALAPRDIAVLPLSSDRRGADAVRAWYQAHDITALPVLLDPRGAMATALQANGIPTTVIINTAGKMVARLEGAADWGSQEAQALIQALTAAG
ncbi:MAG TPA: TlpA disulfide reductase family protein [Rhodopila sp.]|nr:TlpA disulfide reductase family protein [Rhodopila sp.]